MRHLLKRSLAFALTVAVFNLVPAALAANTPKAEQKPASVRPSVSDKSEAEETASYRELSDESVARLFAKLSDKLDSIQSEIDQLNEHKERVAAAQTALTNAQLPDLTSEIQGVNEALNALGKLPPDKPVFKEVNSPGGMLEVALSQLHQSAAAPVLEIVSSVLPTARTLMPGQPPSQSVAEQIAAEAASHYPEPQQTVFLSTYTPALLNLSNRIVFNQGVSAAGLKRGDLETDIVPAQNEAKDLGASARKFFEDLRSKYKPILQAVDKRLQEGVQKREEARNRLGAQVSDIEKEKSRRAQSVVRRQGTLTDNLIWTELLMIAAIVGALFYLRVYPERLALTMVQERTLGDLLGMGLLLITIIFLATGNFVDKSALVTLLGTIAGYIFGRRSPALPAEAGAAGVTTAPPPPKNLRLVPSHTAGQLSLACDEVEDAIGYRWYTRPARGGHAFVFRKQTTEPQIVLGDLASGDKLEVAVSATTGREGKKSAPIKATVP